MKPSVSKESAEDCMKILVTGVSGYLGGAILKTVLAQDYTVRGLYRTPPDRDSVNDLNRCEIFKGDLLDPPSLFAALEGCDAVIHTAALVSIWRRNREDFYQTNVQGTLNLLQAAKARNVSRIVYTASFFALGPTDTFPADENWNRPYPFPPPDYVQSKVEADRLVMDWIQKGMDIVSVYPVLVYGPGRATQGNHITQFMDDYLHRRIPGILGDGSQRWTLSYIQDVAQGHWLALKKGRSGERYILGGEDSSQGELLELLETITGIPQPRKRIPFGVAKGVARWEEIHAYFSRNYLPKITRRVVDVYKCHWRYSSQKAVQELGYTRTPLKLGVTKTLESLGFTAKFSPSYAKK